MGKKQGEFRVAMYMRVGHDYDLREMQERNRKDFVRANPDVEAVAQFCDVGLRDAELERLMVACQRGEIDRVVTRSMSRFSRNGVECLAIIRKLQSLGADVVFEKERIDTSDEQADIYGVFAKLYGKEALRNG